MLRLLHCLVKRRLRVRGPLRMADEHGIVRRWGESLEQCLMKLCCLKTEVSEFVPSTSIARLPEGAEQVA